MSEAPPKDKLLVSTPQIPQRKSLFGLPAEVCLEILRHVLGSDGVWKFWAHCSTPEQTSRARAFNLCKMHALLKRRSLDLGFLRTCRQTHTEGSEVFYGENEFRFSARNGHPVANLFMPKVKQQH